MIELWPAIDLIGSTSVRLTEGKYDSEEKMSRSAEESIAYYSQFECVNRIHIVDLIGAKAQHAQEFDYIKSLRRLTTKDIEVGGGNAQHFVELFDQTDVSAGLAASILHDRETTVQSIKEVIRQGGIAVR